jgi:hypothetical protein
VQVEVSLAEVEDLLMKVKRGSAGHDGIPSWVLRDYAAFLAPAVQHIFQLSVNHSTVPDTFKMANVTPVPK